MTTNKYKNSSKYPENLLVEMQYVFRDKKTRLYKGPVTGRGYGKWKYGEKGLIHVADAIVFVERRVFYPVDTQDYEKKKYSLEHAGDKRKRTPRALDVSKLKFVGEATVGRFHELGLNNVEAIANLTPEELANMLGLPHINAGRAKIIIDDAKKVLESNDLL